MKNGCDGRSPLPGADWAVPRPGFRRAGRCASRGNRGTTSLTRAVTSVTVLASDQQDVCRQLASKGTEKFAGLDVALSDHGHPVIANAIAQIDCDIHAVIDAGDHWFVLGKVLSLQVSRDDDPMLFHRGQYGGFSANS